eukprot:CAMPEP_0184489374 /NCGR_PEP_ID=MMETSP0113_2-20130426/15203_1 /TAXON_ID=91329 /ORGANISM="Norrisiella sphaerica, Strain BC52" /LENGTH=101 /DNA_ID=CAMNT_0026872745 /DNA_START=234 /DNA_END=539 /DNA_ORIENTATION=+
MALEHKKQKCQPGWGEKHFIPKNSWLRKGAGKFPGNRYDISPGKWWDGTHRGVGFEESILNNYRWEPLIRGSESEFFDISDSESKNVPFLKEKASKPKKHA